MVMVTGATGHIGNVLVRQLLAQGEAVRVLVLPGERMTALKGLDVQIAYGDVTKLESLLMSFKGVNTVFHLAGIVRIAPGKKDLLYNVNVQGVNNVIEACLQCGVRRLVYTSSVHAFIEPPQGKAIDEQTPIDPDNVFGDYGKSKATATLAILDAQKKKGLDAVIVAPSGVIGPYDFNLSEMGQMILDFMNKKLKAYIDGAYDFVDVRDVANGIIGASRLGKSGEMYILAGHRLKISRILSTLESITKIKAPQYKMPGWLAIIVSPFSNLYYWIIGVRPLFTKYSVRVLFSNAKISSAKAKKELGFSSRPSGESLVDSVKWFDQNKR